MDNNRFDNYPPENIASSPLSSDDTPVTKKWKGIGKRVVTVKMGGVDGSRIKGEVYPPSDSWAWRKYGQKPIKGSPYPRGYYRCSSSKGCPAKKQVERSHVDPNTVVITYACDHNHSIPVATKNLNTAVPFKLPPEELAVFANQPDLEPGNHEFAEFTGECGWLPDAAAFTVLETPVTVGTTCAEAGVSVAFKMGEEDESLFADLGELPECSLVFGRSDENRRRLCSAGTLSCGSTG